MAQGDYSWFITQPRAPKGQFTVDCWCHMVSMLAVDLKKKNFQELL